MKTEKVKLSQLKVNAANPRTIREQKLNLLVERLLVFPKMIAIRPVVVDDTMTVLGGNMRVNALNKIATLSFAEISEIIGRTKNYQRLTDIEKEQLLASWQSWLEDPTTEVVRASSLTKEEQKEFIIADNSSFGEWDYDRLANEWNAEDLNSWGVDVWQPENYAGSGGGFGGGAADLAIHEQEENGGGETADPALQLSLNDKFIVPPFSVLDTRQGYWQERKNKWRAIIGEISGSRNNLLIQSYEMRYNHIYKKYTKERQALGIGFKEFFEKYVPQEEKDAANATVHSVGTSLFDPVLSEVLCRWFTPYTGAKIFDCFAGDTQKGFVFGYCGYEFCGIELRKEQVKINEEVLADRKLPVRYICDDGQNVAKHFEYESQDMLFSCPPYYDLEKYSDLDNDASNQPTYEEFLRILDNAFSSALTCLKQNRFAVVVVGDVRSKETGCYYDLPSDIKRIFIRNGAHLYNDIILIECVGSSGMRAENNMNRNGRKATKVHQNVLIFYKGDPTQICNEFAPINLTEAEQSIVDNIAEKFIDRSEDEKQQDNNGGGNEKYNTPEDRITREYSKYCDQFRQKGLLDYEAYPAIKDALLEGNLHIERDPETNEIIGSLWLQHLKTKNLTRIYEITSVRKGLGRKLIEKAIADKQYDKLQLDVVEQNTNAIGFYQHMGFVEVSRHKNKAGLIITMEYQRNANN